MSTWILAPCVSGTPFSFGLEGFGWDGAVFLTLLGSFNDGVDDGSVYTNPSFVDRIKVNAYCSMVSGSASGFVVVILW